MQQKSRKPTRVTHIVSTVLEDGTVVETLYRPAEHKTVFVTSHNGMAEEHQSLQLPGLGDVAPYSPRNNLLTHQVILLPSGVGDYDTTETLVAEIRAFVHRYADLPDGFEEIASYYVLLSWVYDAFREIPYLRFQGDTGSGKSRCLLTIGSLCYKSIFASGASTVSPLFRILDSFRGTLVLDEADFRASDERAEIVKILNNGNAAGFPVLRSEQTPTNEFNPRAFAVFGPKLIASRGTFDDRALESRCITEALSGLPPRADIPLSLPRQFHQEADAIRNKLLAFRLMTLHTIENVERLEDSELEPRIAQMFAPLLAVIADHGARDRVLARARAASRAIKAERSATLEAQLLDILWEARSEAQPLAIKAIAEAFAARFGADYLRPITPRWIGTQLRKRLSLTTIKVHGNFVVSPGDAPRLRLLFERYAFSESEA